MSSTVYKRSTVLRNGKEFSFEVDSSKDYFAEIDRTVPAWIMGATVDLTGKAMISDIEKGANSLRTMNVRLPNGSVTEFTMPWQRYLRAIDPAGNLSCLTVTTCQKPDDDETGFEDKIKAIKKRAGWFIAERGEEYNGLLDQEYGAFVLALAKHRAAAHAEAQAEQEKTWATDMEKQFAAQSERQSDMLADVMEKQGIASNELISNLVTKLAEALAAQSNSKNAPRKAAE